MSGGVIVAEPPEIMSLTVNDTGGVVTLNESADDTLSLSCDARGVPSPALRLFRVSVGPLPALRLFRVNVCKWCAPSLRLVR